MRWSGLAVATWVCDIGVASAWSCKRSTLGRCVFAVSLRIRYTARYVCVACADEWTCAWVVARTGGKGEGGSKGGRDEEAH